MLIPILVAALFGAFIGSFCNVVIHRMPRNESVVQPPSRCYACGTGVCWYDNLPVLSWLILRGRCRHCGSPFSIRYMLGELAVAAITALAIWMAMAELPARTMVLWSDVIGLNDMISGGLAGAALCLCAWWLWVTSAIDVQHTVIPDELTKPLQLLAPLLALLAPVGRDIGWQADGWMVSQRGQDIISTPWAGVTATLWWVVPAVVFLVVSLPLARWVYTKWLPQAQWQDDDLRGMRVGVWWFIGVTILHVLLLVVVAWCANGVSGQEKYIGAVALIVDDWQNAVLPPGTAGAAWLVVEAQLATAILGSLAGWMVLYVVGLGGTIALRRYALGFGDVKLLAPLGAMLGPVGIGYAFALAAMVGALVGIPWRLCGGEREIPFGPFLAVGAVLAAWFGADLHALIIPPGLF